MLAAQGDLLAFERSEGDERLLCVFNLGKGRCDWMPAVPKCWRPIATIGDIAGWSFGPHAGLIAKG